MGSPSFARMALPPGFRFHPTDVELIMYWLKRKVSGKKLHFEAIAEVNIYNFSPWDLPDMSCLGSKDLEWFFFCPREKKYASGTRVKRATENGYWKTTGKDRYIYYNDRVAGTVKTLVFHLGHPPKGERTDWVIHEYKIIDGALAAAGVQDSYVLCKVFKKNGLGPKNGAQYGAPFNEADWADEDVDALNVASSVAPAGPSHTASLPEKPSSPMAGSFDPGSTPAMSLIEEGPTINGKSHVVGLFDAGSISGQSLIKDVPNGKHSFISTGLFNPGNTSGLALIEEELAASAMPSNNEVLVDQSDDDIIRLLSSFTDDDTLFLSNQNGKNVNHKDNHNGKRKDTSAPCLDGYEIYNGLGDLNNCSQMNEVGLDFSGMQNFPLNDMVFPENMDFIELNDLQTPLNCSAEDIARELAELSGSYNHENMQYIGSADGFDGMGHYSWESQLPMLPDGSNQANSNYEMLQGVSDQFPQVSNMVYDLEFACGLPGNWENGGHHLNQDMERGSQNTKYIPKTSECIPFRSPSAAKHLALSFSSRGDSSIHIKAEVTCDVGVCTKEALSVMVGESSSCWWNVPLADFQAMWVWVACHLLYSSDFGSHLSYCYYLDGSLFISRSCYRHWCSGNSHIIFLLACISAVMLKTISLHAPLNICKLILVFSVVVESLII